MYDEGVGEVRMIFNQLTDDDPDGKELDLLDPLIRIINRKPGKSSLLSSIGQREQLVI